MLPLVESDEEVACEHGQIHYQYAGPWLELLLRDMCDLDVDSVVDINEGIE